MLSSSNGSPERMDLDRVLRVWSDEMARGMDRPALELVQMLALADFKAGIDPEEPYQTVAVWGERLARCGDADGTAREALGHLSGISVSGGIGDNPEIRIAFYDA